MPSLVVKQGPLAGERFDVAAEIVLGREGDVRLEDEGTSRRHARVRPVDGAVEVEDLGSLNGTWVNGERITAPTRLKPGDVLRLGETSIELEAPPQPAETVMRPLAEMSPGLALPPRSSETVAAQVPRTPTLVVKDGPLTGERIEIVAEVVLGREADLTLDDDEMSRRHARIRPLDDAVEVEDLDSLNGTWVNGNRITEPTRLRPGDVLRLGATSIELDPLPSRTGETMATPLPRAAETVVAAVPRLPSLLVKEGPLAGERLEIDAEVVLGREGDIVLSDHEVSRHHARVRPLVGAFEVEDLGSLNGTWVNDRRITEPTRLGPGDVLRLGTTVIEVPSETGAAMPVGRPSAAAGAPVARAAALHGAPSLTERLARACSSKAGLTLGIWIGTIVLSVVLIVLFLPTAISTDRAFTNNPESKRATTLIQELFPDPNRVDDVVLVRADGANVQNADFRRTVQQLTTQIEQTGVTAAVANFYRTRNRAFVSPDGDATTIQVRMSGDETEAEANAQKLLDAVRPGEKRGKFEVFITGEVSSDLDRETLSQEDLKKGEAFFGGPVALIVLLLVFGSVIAAFLPLLLAIGAIVVALGVVAVVGQAFQLNLFVVNMLTGMGLALGVDYTLFVLSRYREERAEGKQKLDAIAVAGSTASRAVLFSGVAFVVALMGMLLVPDTILRSLAFGAIVVGLVSVVAALTLLPAVISLLGDKINALRVPIIGRAIVNRAAGEARFWAKVASVVMRRPAISLALAVTLLLLAAVPVLDIKTGQAGISTFPDYLVSKQGFTALDKEFRVGGPDPAEIVVVGDLNAAPVKAAVGKLEAAIGRDQAFGKPQKQITAAGDAALLTVPIVGDATSEESTDAVQKLRDDLIPQAFSGTNAEALVTGAAAETIDYSELIGTWLPIVFAIVFAFSFILLMLAFRSIIVPVKAIILNLLSVAAAYGLVVLVFQKGVGADLLGFQQVDSVEAWVPLFLFSVLFGLSMDYHVFLLSRIRERFTLTGDNTEAVAYGVASTARLITGAALIMIAVFTGFAIGDLAMFQQMGFGLAVALFLDATIVRSVLVPAGMQLLGERNWYLPKWLSWLPDVSVEGHPASDAVGRPKSAPPR